ncbi:cytochrome-c oxidase, cbb3-type subunit III [Sulfitobacter donghicola]|uniref:Cbb3-type cytochrome c oxidase subunit n=1 Tax=Sulfitobacter donghicola DSW-25 = KCTC 12864 = JCM 14565 TaxID=1300350 RepID=A0A073IDT4_9RHOB|nr:cytochrome-c oxidase, cbb3-type subunit III [Sulfitobacter donghicola]KEJ87904.1 cytochrome CBB3 [Sulfitobacter donghicola DSW-25 = KCTC 12864 = JCM 14565]KIN67249.1 Cbb3-type cytochrome c oxidase subunit [Sulfitobacter donghicola DSW-25 = KCTC 12864 = JCM 14565]
MTKKKVDETTGVETTGHEWDGIKELNNPLPRWWLWTLYACIIWGVAYTVAYPAWPMISGATKGMLGFSTRAQVAEDIVAHEAKNNALVEELLAADLTALKPGDDLHRYAVARGGSVFRAQCSQCHGSGAAGAKGYPNLRDDDWLWGGDLETIVATIDHGIRNETDGDARWSEMPAFGEILSEEEIDQVVAFVGSLSGPAEDEAMVTAGAVVYEDNCSSCHMEAGTGDRETGAPNLADAIWLYGGDAATIKQTVKYSRFGVMPAWGQRLSDEDVSAVAVYVHNLGGGE